MGKSVLIVNHKLEELSLLRSIVAELDFSVVGAASSVNMAMSYLRQTPFDLVLVSYDLGNQEKSGLQIIQEMYAEKLSLFQTTFLLVADAEQSSTLLIGSLESAPDAYIYRPFNRNKIKSTLEKLFRVKQAVLPMTSKMDQGKWDKAIISGGRLVNQYPGLQAYLERLQGLCFLQSNNPEAAEQLFVDVSAARQQPWARVGLGIALYRTGQYPRAIEVLQAVVDQQHISVEAYIWLARSLRIMGQAQQALTLMKKAVMIQPTIPQLHTELANQAAQNGEWSSAINGFRLAQQYSRYSIFQSMDDYFGRVNALIAQYREKPGNGAALEVEAVRVLEAAVSDFRDDARVQFRSYILLAELRKALGNTELYEFELSQAENLLQRLAPEEQCRWIDSALDVAENSTSKATFAKQRSQLLKEAKAPWIEQTVTGLRLYQQGKRREAFNAFLHAEQLGAQSPTATLNLMQAGVELLRLSGKSALDAVEWGKCVERFQHLHYGSLSVKQFDRYQKIMQLLAQLQN